MRSSARSAARSSTITTPGPAGGCPCGVAVCAGAPATAGAAALVSGWGAGALGLPPCARSSCSTRWSNCWMMTSRLRNSSCSNASESVSASALVAQKLPAVAAITSAAAGR
ncbi:hypothetical protein F0M18_10465 [Pseudohalioglobus sediminis]|uniref:Uncharacterized protein n=1 Tax=Pseudohalioglobus sediminis TaxID=2606449 RepID=A0A5B0X0R6_9GAMM|nr:hypothetical protein F0M18_10465 [Pseudohalioglobus sediminis]